MTIIIKWYERNVDFSANYNKEHHGTIVGDGASDVWRKFIEHGNTHDLSKYTRREIIGMYD